MRQVWLLFLKDLLIERRAWTRLVALICFAIMALLLFSFAVGPDSSLMQRHASGYLWLSALFASAMLFTQSFLVETESGAIRRLLLTPVSPAALFYGKALANTLQLLVLLVALLPPLVALCDVHFVESPIWLSLSLLLGAFGIAAPGALYAAMTARLSAQQLLMPLLLFPLTLPALIAAVKVGSLVFNGDPMNQIGSWLQLLAAFDLIYWSLCGVLFDKIIEA